MIRRRILTKFIWATIGIGVVTSVGALALSPQPYKEDKFKTFKEENAIPTGFQTSPAATYVASLFTVLSDHEVIGMFTDVEMQPNGNMQVKPRIDDGTESHFVSENKDDCRVIGRKLDRLDLNTGNRTKIEFDESIGIRPLGDFTYRYPGMKKNLVNGNCGTYLMSLDGKATATLAKGDFNLQSFYWKPINRFLRDGKEDDHAYDNDHSRLKVKFGKLGSDRHTGKLLGVDSEDRLIYSWEISRNETGICRGRYIDGNVVFEEVARLKFTENEEIAISLTGDFMAFSRYVPAKEGPGSHNLVLLNLDTYEEQVVGSYTRTQIKGMMITPDNKFIVLALPNTMAWKNIQNLKWKSLDEVAPYGKRFMSLDQN